MGKPAGTEPTSVPAAEERATPPGAEGLVSAEDKAWFENLLDQAKDRPLTPEENQKLAEKYKGYDRSISKHRGELERQRDDLQSQKQELQKVLEELRSAKSDKEVSSALKGTSSSIRDLLEDAIERTDDPSSRETLRWLDKVLQQRLAKLDKFEQEMTELRQSIEESKNSSSSMRQQVLEREIKELTNRYGESVVDQYRDAIIQYGTRNPNYSARQLLHMIAAKQGSMDEIEQAVELQARKATKPPGSTGSRGSAPVSTAPEHPSEEFRGKKPADIRRGLDKAFDKVFEAAKGKIPGL